MVMKGRNNSACTNCSWQEAILENSESEDTAEELAPVGG